MTREEVIRAMIDAALPLNLMGQCERFAALLVEHLKSEGWRQCAVGQRTTQFCDQVERAREDEREACAAAVLAVPLMIESRTVAAMQADFKVRAVEAIRARGNA